MERFYEWAEDLEAIDRDRALTNVMAYWLTGTAGSSARLYYEAMHSGTWGQPRGTVPTGVANFARDYAIRRYAEKANNIVHWSKLDRGGHFAAMEVLELFTAEVRKCFRPLRRP